jgi:hypothetical protein
MLLQSCRRGHRHRRLLDPDLLNGVRSAMSIEQSNQKAPGATVQASAAARAAQTHSGLATAFFGRRAGASAAGGAEAQLAAALGSIEDRLAQMEQM